MIKGLPDLAAFGGAPAFAKPVHVAQVNLPAWSKVEEAFHGIFERRYFANHGPLVRELEQAFAESVGARHAVCVTNGTVALMILAKALDLSGEVIVPAFTFPATVQALSWAGLTPVLCDVDLVTHMLSPQTVAPRLTARTSAILGVHLWGRACEPSRLEALAAELKLKLFFDASHGVGCTWNGRRIGTFGAAEAFSFHATKVLNGAEGGCITTEDDETAAKLRTIRSFHPSETFVPSRLRMNGKMSEAQAALARLSLDDLAGNIAANRGRYDTYRRGLADIPGIALIEYDDTEANNYQYVVVEIDEKAAGLHRDVFLKLLAAENVLCRRHFTPGIHRMPPYSDMSETSAGDFAVTDRLCQRVLQLPSAQAMSIADVELICALIRGVQHNAELIRRKASGLA